jgi:SAM-dependent methyltransferase
MNIWNYVAQNTFDSPDKQIQLLVDKLKSRIKKRTLKILDAGGGNVDRSQILSSLGLITTLDLIKRPHVDVIGDLHDLPFENNSFDVIAMLMVLEHLHDPLIAIKECHRVLKKSGYLIVTTVQYWHTHEYPNDYYRYTKSGLLHLLNESKFSVEDIWSMGGPILVLYHVIELNLPDFFRKLFILSCPLFDYLDYLFFKHEDKRKNPDSIGWALISKKI